MSEASAALAGGGLPMDATRSTKAAMANPIVDTVALPEIKKDFDVEEMLGQARKMLTLMQQLKDGQEVVVVGDFAQEKTKLRIVEKDKPELGEGLEFGALSQRYRTKEREAIKQRQAEREHLAYTVAKHTGKPLSEMGIKLVAETDNYLSKSTQIDVWTKKDGKPIVERLNTQEMIERFDSQKISANQALKNLKKVYGSARVATEKYLNATAFGQVLGKAVESGREKTATIARQAEAMDAVPAEKKGLWHKVKRVATAIKQTIDKPLAPVEAVVKAVAGYALYDANPVRKAIGGTVEKLWTEIPIAKDLTMRELAARLEEKLMVDPLTGEGVRTGPITPDKIREASVEGAKWAIKMQVVPELMAKLPAIKALALKPSEIYSILRSSRMVKSGAGTIRSLAKKFHEAYKNGDKVGMAKIAGWSLGSAVGFTLAEKLSPVVAGVNPALMADVALMRLSGEVEKYASKQGLEKTELTETLETVETGITGAFAAESANTLGNTLWSLAETGSANPLAEIKDEESLLAMVEQHPDYLDESGNFFGSVQEAEHELISFLKGEEEGDSEWKTFAFENGNVYHVDPGSDGESPVVIRQDQEGDIAELHGKEWVSVAPEQEVQEPIPEPVSSEVESEPISAVHDYIYFEPGTTKMVFRMDLVAGETWDTKVQRLFEGYGENGGIDDPASHSFPDGKTIQAMPENTPELTALTGQDGVYETQIHEMLINRLLTDAQNNGLVYDQQVVQERMVAFLQADTTADADTVEGEIDYGELYQHLFLGSEVTKNVAEIDTAIYQPYFLSGNEGSDNGVETKITIPEGGTVLGELAEQGYGSGGGQLFDAQGNLLQDAQIVKVEADGNERVVEDFAELDSVQPGDEFVLRTGIGAEESLNEGESPAIIPLSESKLSSFELPATPDQIIEDQSTWEDEVVRNEEGEIYLGTVGEGDYFSQMMVDRFSGTLDNSWDLLTVFQNMDANGVSIYAENESGEKRFLNSYDDLETLYVGERIVIVDPNRVIAEVPDQDVLTEVDETLIEEGEDKVKDDSILPSDRTQTVPTFTIPGFTEDGIIDLQNPPAEIMRDKAGNIYIGEIQDGTWLSMLVAARLPGAEGVDTWQRVNELYESGQIQILKATEDGVLTPMTDLNTVNVGDQIVISDPNSLLENIGSVGDVATETAPMPIEQLLSPESSVLDIDAIKASLEATIANLGDGVDVRLTVVDLDNEANLLDIGTQESFKANDIQKVAIAMAILRMVDSGELSIEAPSEFVVLPGDYKPSIGQLLSLMLVQGDSVARDGLLKEMVGQDMQDLLGSNTGLIEVMQDQETTSDEVAKVYQTMLRTNYLSDESRDLLQGIIEDSQSQTGGLLASDLHLYEEVKVREISNASPWVTAADEIPEYSSQAQVTTSDGRELVVIMTVDSDDGDAARSAMRTVARELSENLGESAVVAPELELNADIAQQVSISSQSQIDFVNHVIAPYRSSDGNYLYDPLLMSSVVDFDQVDLSAFDKEVTINPDGSGAIHLASSDKSRVITILVGNDQRVQAVFDSEMMKGRGMTYEVYPEDKGESEAARSPAVSGSEGMQATVAVEVAVDFAFETSLDRQNFVDVVRAGGKSYDYYVFLDAQNQPVVMYGGDGDRGEPTTIALVGSPGLNEIDNPAMQQALESIVAKLGDGTGSAARLGWVENGVVLYDPRGDAWDETQPHWFNQITQVMQTDDSQVDLPPAQTNVVFSGVILDTFGQEMKGETTEIVVDGVRYFETTYIPEGMDLDRAVVARSHGITMENLVLYPTSDANTYLLGEKLSPDKYEDPAVKATFTHPKEELLYQYADGTLSSEFLNDPSNPLAAVYPLEKPLSAYTYTDRLIKLPERMSVAVQYQGEPYFVPSEEGMKDDIFVDPVTMTSYVKSGEDFIRLVTDSYTYAQMREIYQLDPSLPVNSSQIWSRRVGDEMAQTFRERGVNAVYRDGHLVMYQDAAATREQVMEPWVGDGQVQYVDKNGNLVFANQEGESYGYRDGLFVPTESSEIVSLTDYLKDFTYATTDGVVPLQLNGNPVLMKDELLYLVSQEGVVLIGSKYEFQLDGLVADPDVAALLNQWGVEQAGSIDISEKDFSDYSTEEGKILHDLAIRHEELIEVTNGVVDRVSGKAYLFASGENGMLYDLQSGKPVFISPEGKGYLVWAGSEWVEVGESQVAGREEYLSSQELSPVDDQFDRGITIDRRMQSSVYVKDGWAYVLSGDGLERIGQIDAVMKTGFVGYVDETGAFETYTPEKIDEIYGNATYTPPERLSLLLNPILNAYVGFRADLANLWSDYGLIDALPKIKQEDYLVYGELPPQYLAALISQENKTLYREGDGEAANLDIGVIAKVMLSGGERGGSTLVQGLVKNMLMSPEERLDRSISRKFTEILMADQLLESMSVEEVVAMYANTVSYGSVDGVSITGINQAAEVLFGKEVGELDLVEIGLLVAVPNYPNRNNIYTYENAQGWADSASGVYRHMYENGFITQEEMEQAFFEVHDRLLPSGSEADIQYLLSNGYIESEDEAWVREIAKEYQQLEFEERQIQIDGSQSATYTSFFSYLSIKNPEQLEWTKALEATEKYFAFGDQIADKLAVAEGSVAENNSIELGKTYTTKEYVQGEPDYTPQVVEGNDGNMQIDPWAHRYEAMEKDEQGNPLVYNVVSGGEGGPAIVQDQVGRLWEVGEHGLIRVPGAIYQIEGGGVVQAMPANDRPGMLLDVTGDTIDHGQFVKDSQGNYFRVVEGNKVEYVGRAIVMSEGYSVLYKLDRNVSYEVAAEPKDFLLTTVQNILRYTGTPGLKLVGLEQGELPVSNDPNMGYVLPRGQGEYGLINPHAAQEYLSAQGFTSQAVELSSGGNGGEIFKAYVGEVLGQDKPLIVWLNTDLAAEVEQFEADKPYFETISRFERPVSVLQMFEIEGKQYVVYQDPTQIEPQVVSWAQFEKLASPLNMGRFKTLVVGEYEVSDVYQPYLYDPHAQIHQAGVLIEDGYVYNYENPSAAEETMSINPAMQAFVSQEAAKIVQENGTRGFVGIAMDENGRIPFYVALDENGEADTERAQQTYQPGSIYKLVTAMWALNSGVKPNEEHKAGDYYQWKEGDKTYNWTMDPVTGQLKYSKGADSSMNLIDGLTQSNNPFFLGLVANAADYHQFSQYANLVGFGDGQGLQYAPSQDSFVPNPGDESYTLRDVAYNAIGQGPVSVAPLEMLTFVSAIANGGNVIEPILSRELPQHSETSRLPNQPTDYAVMMQAMEAVTSDPDGTAYTVFHDVEGYDVYGKTGTAEVGDGETNAWFVGWAVDQETGEKLSFVFLFPNGGEGSTVAAPFARQVLDQYFSDVRANQALEAGGEELASGGSEIVPVAVVPTPTIVQVEEVEQGVANFRLEDQPNKEMIILATEATRIANEFVPSREGMSIQEEGSEFVDYLKTELRDAGYSELVESPEMTVAFDLLLNDYKSYGGTDPSERESVQCVAWQVFLGQTRSVLTGAPVTMTRSGDADDVVSDVLQGSLQTGDPYNGGIVVRMPDDKPNITLMEPGDTFYVKYPRAEDDLGHAGIVLAKSTSHAGEPIVLVSDANRYVDENGQLITDGKLRLRWLTQAQFDEQYTQDGDRVKGIAASQLVVIRPPTGEQIQSVLDPNYHSEIAPQPDWLDAPTPNWQFVPDESGKLELPAEADIHYQTENVGDFRPIESIYIHWSGSDSTDTSTWTAEMVMNGLQGEETSSTFAVGRDAIWQMAQMKNGQVQETYATPWQRGAVNIEIAGQDFDNNPPSPEQYQKVVDLVTQLLISSNKPVSIVKPHYQEIYVWSDDVDDEGKTVGWITIDSRDLSDPSKVNYMNENGEWVSLSQADFTYKVESVQSKADPGEQFFAQLKVDVARRLVALGRSDLATSSEIVASETDEAQIAPSELELRVVDQANPITSEEIESEIMPYLVSVDAVDPVLNEAAIGDDILLHSTMMPDLKAMILATREANIPLYLSSGYRSFEEQTQALLEKNGDPTLAMVPGQSQHHTGLAIDFTSQEIGMTVGIEQGFENTEAGKWLWENGWRYGFVQSYTKNHDGVQNETWHYYYVGKTYARIWHDSQLTDHPRDIFEILNQINSPEG